MDEHRIGNDISYTIDLKQFINRGYLKERKVYSPGDTDFENLDNGSDQYVHWRDEVYNDVYYNYRQSEEQNTGEQSQTTVKTTPVCIQSVKVYFVNETLKSKILDSRQKRSRFMTRFPVEPYMNAFDSNAYDINGCGRPVYRACPVPKRFVPYSGFGVYPEWDRVYAKRQPRLDVMYLAETFATDKQNVIEARFPAKHQKYTGVYSILVIAKIYVPGYNGNNLKTITIDFPNKLKLCATTADATSSDILGEVQNVTDVVTQYGSSDSGDASTESSDPIINRDIYVDYAGFDGDRITLTRTDMHNMDIDLDGIGAWYESE